LFWDQCEIGVGCRPAARIACRTSPASELLEIRAADAGLLFQLARRASREVTVPGDVDEASRQCEAERKRFALTGRALHQQHLKLVVANRKDHDVDRGQGPREIQLP